MSTSGMVRLHILIGSDVASHSTVVRQKAGIPSPQPKGPHQSVGVHGGDEQKSAKGGGHG